MTNNMIADPYFGSEEWKEQFMQERKEKEFKEIMMLVSDALLLASERDMFSIRAILSVAIKKLETLGINCNINGKKRLEIKND